MKTIFLNYCPGPFDAYWNIYLQVARLSSYATVRNSRGNFLLEMTAYYRTFINTLIDVSFLLLFILQLFDWNVDTLVSAKNSESDFALF